MWYENTREGTYFEYICSVPFSRRTIKRLAVTSLQKNARTRTKKKKLLYWKQMNTNPTKNIEQKIILVLLYFACSYTRLCVCDNLTPTYTGGSVVFTAVSTKMRFEVVIIRTAAAVFARVKNVLTNTKRERTRELSPLFRPRLHLYTPFCGRVSPYYSLLLLLLLLLLSISRISIRTDGRTCRPRE